MPDASQRLKDSTLKSMNYILFSLNSFHVDADIKIHPRMVVIFNDVSRYGDFYNPETIKEDKKANKKLK